MNKEDALVSVCVKPAEDSKKDMTVSKAFRKCVELVEEMVREGYRLQIPSTQVEKLVRIRVGADKRTVQKYVKLLSEDMGFLETTVKNPSGICIFRINIETIERFVSEHLKEKYRRPELLDLSLGQEEKVKAGST
jgi:hypothetical protein